MRHLNALTVAEARALRGLFFDLDDTLLDHGKLGKAAYESLFLLKSLGLSLVALTGRPASWADFIARVWPVDGAVAENGALGFAVVDGRLSVFDPVTAEERQRRRDDLLRLIAEIRKACPELVPADDAHQRVSDFTFDIGEHERASEQSIERAMAIGRERRAKMTRSSVHLHFGFDREDKASGALRFLRSRGEDPTRVRLTYGFIGDSENDAPAFAAFKTTVGVQNVRGGFTIPPRFVTSLPRGDGFSEFARKLAELRA